MAQRTAANAAVRFVFLSVIVGRARFNAGTACSQRPLFASWIALCELGEAVLAACPKTVVTQASRTRYRGLNIRRGRCLRTPAPIISAGSIIKLERELNDAWTF